MGTKYLKANIRFDKIHTRNNKPHYTHLTVEQKKFVKALEQVKQYEKEIGKYDRSSNKEWRKTEAGQILLEQYFYAHEKYMKISSKMGLSELEENQLLNSCHTSRYYGGSF